MSGGPDQPDMPELGKFLENLQGIGEMLDNLAKVKGVLYAQFVGAIFSMGNLQQTYAMIASRIANTEEQEAANIILTEGWSSQMSVMISSFAEATLKQDKDWSGYSEEEKQHKKSTYVENMRKDVMMFARKQDEK